MKKLLMTLFLSVPCLAYAAGGGYHLDHAPIDVTDKNSLQRGAKLFVNYCMGCHSAQFERYNRLARDLGLPEKLVQENLILTAGTKIGDTMKIALPTNQAKEWFGAAPPDLSVIARARGTDYLYTYLRTFYLDDSRPWGVNNAAFPSVGMPHVLWQLQGWQKPIYETDPHDANRQVITGFELVQPGSMTVPEFDRAAADLVNFLSYVAEPIQLERKRVGIWVLLYLVLCFAVFYPLKKEYWKDVH